jgi:hypothetical protein
MKKLLVFNAGFFIFFKYNLKGTVQVNKSVNRLAESVLIEASQSIPL